MLCIFNVSRIELHTEHEKLKIWRLNNCNFMLNRRLLVTPRPATLRLLGHTDTPQSNLLELQLKRAHKSGGACEAVWSCRAILAAAHWAVFMWIYGGRIATFKDGGETLASPRSLRLCGRSIEYRGEMGEMYFEAVTEDAFPRVGVFGIRSGCHRPSSATRGPHLGQLDTRVWRLSN